MPSLFQPEQGRLGACSADPARCLMGEADAVGGLYDSMTLVKHDMAASQQNYHFNQYTGNI